MSPTVTIFGVEWLSSRDGDGQRPEGWRLHLAARAARDAALQDAHEANVEAAGGRDYVGPALPIRVFAIPCRCVQWGVLARLAREGSAFSTKGLQPGARQDIAEDGVAAESVTAMAQRRA